MRCIVIAAGDLSSLEALDLTINKQDIILCADGGYAHAKRLGITPTLIMGDFDSYEDSLPEGIEVKRFDSIKDDTDTMLAIKEGIVRGCDDFVLIGALGGRLDHSYANIQGLAYLVEQGYSACILDADTSIYMIKNSAMKLQKREGYAVSVFAYSETCTGVALGGLFYSLTGATVTQNFPIGVSNKFEDAYAEISVEQGTLLIMLCKY